MATWQRPVSSRALTPEHASRLAACPFTRRAGRSCTGSLRPCSGPRNASTASLAANTWGTPSSTSLRPPARKLCRNVKRTAAFHPQLRTGLCSENLSPPIRPGHRSCVAYCIQVAWDQILRASALHLSATQPPAIAGWRKDFSCIKAWLCVYRTTFQFGTKWVRSELSALSKLHFPCLQTALDSNP